VDECELTWGFYLHEMKLRKNMEIMYWFLGARYPMLDAGKIMDDLIPRDNFPISNYDISR
jgi:hypothetical protein